MRKKRLLCLILSVVVMLFLISARPASASGLAEVFSNQNTYHLNELPEEDLPYYKTISAVVRAKSVKNIIRGIVVSTEIVIFDNGKLPPKRETMVYTVSKVKVAETMFGSFKKNKYVYVLEQGGLLSGKQILEYYPLPMPATYLALRYQFLDVTFNGYHYCKPNDHIILMLAGNGKDTTNVINRTGHSRIYYPEGLVSGKLVKQKNGKYKWAKPDVNKEITLSNFRTIVKNNK